MNNCFELLEKAAKKKPNKISLIDEKVSLTFREVYNIAANLAIKVDPLYINEPIVILMKKSVFTVCALMGVLCSGNYYVPIDSNMPFERLKKIIEDVQPKYILVDNNTQKVFEKNNYATDISVINLEKDYDASPSKFTGNYKKNVDCNRLAYVIYTSGTTGVPKGVKITQQGVIDYINWAVEQFSLGEETIFGNQAPFHFDNSIFDIYCTFAIMGTLVIIPQIYFSFPKNLIEYLNEQKVNSIFWVPSAIKSLDNITTQTQVEKLKYIKRILFCGEIMSNRLLNRIRRIYPDVLYVNLYGPTEITDACTYYVVDRSFGDEEPLPIGVPRKNAEIFLIDENAEIIHEGIGEICVAGSGVSLGYFKNDDLTRKSFFMLNTHDGNVKRVYKTGDLGYFRNDLLFYNGRRDDQIKRKGYRIELGEIDNVMSMLSPVLETATIYDNEQEILALFYSGNVEEEELKKWARNHLPLYMNPDVYIKIDSMPRKTNMKIDKKELRYE